MGPNISWRVLDSATENRSEGEPTQALQGRLLSDPWELGRVAVTIQQSSGGLPVPVPVPKVPKVKLGTMRTRLKLQGGSPVMCWFKNHGK